MSMGLSFQCFSGSLILGLETAALLVLADIEEVLAQDDAVVTIVSRSTAGTIVRNRSYSSSVQKPITRSTPARLYQERSNKTISPAAGKWAM